MRRNESIRRLGLISLQGPHLKTEQVIAGLLAKSYELKIYALPFQLRPERSPLIEHRPNQFMGRDLSEIADSLGIEYKAVDNDLEIDNERELYQVLCGKLLTRECVREKRILNCHAGTIPAVRGLDAFKWAIYDGKRLGVTLHEIDESVDGGKVLAIEPTETRLDDTIESLAKRHYENEIRCCIDFERLMRSGSCKMTGGDPGDARMRMPRSKEAEVLGKFDDYLQAFGT